MIFRLAEAVGLAICMKKKKKFRKNIEKPIEKSQKMV